MSGKVPLFVFQPPPLVIDLDFTSYRLATWKQDGGALIQRIPFENGEYTRLAKSVVGDTFVKGLLRLCSFDPLSIDPCYKFLLGNLPIKWDPNDGLVIKDISIKHLLTREIQNLKSIANPFTDSNKIALIIPSSLNYNQKLIQRQAAFEAGYQHVQFILYNQALSYQHFKKIPEAGLTKSYSMIASIRGSHTDISILFSSGESISTICHKGLPKGGFDVAKYLFDCVTLNNPDHLSPDLEKQLFSECEWALREPSNLSLGSFRINEDFVLDRQTFLDISMKFTSQVVEIVESALVECNLSKNQVQSLIIHGEYAFIMNSVFDSQEDWLSKIIIPDDSAILGATRSLCPILPNRSIDFQDSRPFHYGIDTKKGFCPILDKNQKSLSCSSVVKTAMIDQLYIYEGNYLYPHFNTYLGTVQVEQKFDSEIIVSISQDAFSGYFERSSC